MEVKQQHDRVGFENVADQYVKGEDITVVFTIYDGIEINLDEDQIGLLRIGCTNMKECLTYSSVQFNSTSESNRSGTATFPSSSLSASDDEFYQFCYINNQTKNLGSSIPFQLNCTLDDIDLLSHQYQGECLEDVHRNCINETNKIRSQLNVTLELAKEQGTQIVDLERRLMQANNLIKTTNQEKMNFEQRLNDTNLTFEKYQMSTQGQLNEYAKQIDLQEKQMNVLERSNSLLCEEINEEIPNEVAYMALKISFNEIEKRCVEHQKNEVELKQELNNCQNSVNDLQQGIRDLTERLAARTEEYKTLLHKYNTYENPQKQKKISRSNSSTDVEIQPCPMCNYQFPQHLTLNQKQEHIEEHFK